MYTHGERRGISSKKWREKLKIKFLRRTSVDSTERSSSLSPQLDSSQEIPTQSTQSKSLSSVQSTSTKSSTSKSNPVVVSKTVTIKKDTTFPRKTLSKTTNKAPSKTPCKAPADTATNVNQTSSNKNNVHSKKTSSDGSKKTNAIKIQVNPLSDPALQRRVSIVEPGECSTGTRQTSFDSVDEDPQPSTSYSKPEEDNITKNKLFESLSSISISSGIYDSSVEQQVLPIYSKTEYKDVRDQLNTEIRYALSQSIPISSKTVYGLQRPAVLDGFSYPPSQEATPKKRQRSASIQLDQSPPSPAPGTPLVIAHRRTRSCERVKSRSWIHEGSWINQNPPDRSQFEPGPRDACSRFPNESRSNIDVERYRRHQILSFSYRKCYYGQSAAHQLSFGKNIYDRFIRHRNLAKKDWSSIGKMNSIDDHERKIIIEFCHLLEKSKQLFNGLRELPQYGHKQWSTYFGRTFDIYTRLWKYQQQHRAILDSKYGMKRWQIGEIASKIGQLYYHFYLRTSETGYLNEAYSFYYAIRGRCYYTKANKEDKCELMVKKLRYYARFIVVCLLLKKIKLVKDLIKELDRQIIEYGNTYDPDDQVEWTVVVDEVKAFIHAEPVVAVIDPDNYTVIISNRLTLMTTPAIERTPQMTLALQEILIVGSSSQQVKFSELTMDMFRMLQTLEREPTGDIPRNVDESPRARYTTAPGAHNQDGMNPNAKLPNPHKYLLFKPSPSQILVYLASGFNDLPTNGALLLYISADGHLPQAPKHAEDVGYDLGGLITTSKNDIYRDSRDPKASSSSKYKEIQCLYPGDLYPFTRRPFFLIVDSDNSYAFQNIPRHFGQPMVVLMSPLELPASFHDRRQQGSLFTLFLHSPLMAFCYCCDISSLALVHWDHGQHIIDNFISEASALLIRSRVDISYISFLGDDFLRLLIVRYMFCEVVLRLHRGFRARSHLTRCSPSLPDDLLEHPALIQIVMDLAAHLQVRSHFHDPAIATGPPTTKD